MSAGKRRGARRRAAIPTEAWYIRRGEGVMPEPRLGTAALIGKGFCSDVYAWGEGRALKLFHGRVAPDRAARKYAVSRAVVSATELLTDGTRNVLPATARIRGDCRSFSPEVSGAIEEAMRRLAEGVAAAHGCAAELNYSREFVPLVNHAAATRAAVEAAQAVFGDDGVDPDCAPITASEDFARFLEHVPGCFVFLGNGTDSLPLHNAAFDFNDDALGYGARFHVEVARRRRPDSGAG